MANETLCFFQSLNQQYSPFILTFFTIVLAVATCALAYFTYMLYNETKKMRELQTDPKLSVYLTSSKIEIIFKNLIIENIGFGPAYNVKFQLSNDFTLRDGIKKLSEIQMIKNGLPYIPPKEKYEFLLTDFPYLKYADEYLTITTTYENATKKSFSENFILDFSIWKNMETLDVKNINHIVTELKKINENIEKIKKEEISKKIFEDNM